MTVMNDIDENIVCIECDSECHINPINSDAADSKIAYCPYCGEELVVDDEDDADGWMESHNEWDDC